MFEDTTKCAPLFHGTQRAVRIVALIQVPQAAVRATRRMRDDRMRPVVEPRVPRLVPAIDGRHRRVNALWIAVKDRNRSHGTCFQLRRSAIADTAGSDMPKLSARHRRLAPADRCRRSSVT